MANSLRGTGKGSSIEDAETSNEHTLLRFLHRITALLTHYGVETDGIVPIPVAERTDTRWYQIFAVWFSASMNILTFGTGTTGPALFSLGVRDAIMVVVVTDLVCCLVPAFSTVFGPKLGMRSMVQCRFSWGYYGSVIPSILNVFTNQGYLILDCIVGGQTLASVSSNVNDTLGIIIISLISLAVTCFGYRILHWYESVAWLPTIVAFITMVAVGYPQLRASQNLEAPTATPSAILSFASALSANVISWCTITPDHGVFHSPAASSWRIFLYAYLGFVIPNITCHALGAAFAAVAPNDPVWNAAFQNNTSVGGLLYGVLTPLGRFGKVLTVLVAFSIPSACVPAMYSVSTSFMCVSRWFCLVPRWVYVLLSEAILIPVAIVGAQKFYATFVDILSFIGYWSAAFSGIVITEHILFRDACFSNVAYSITAWNDSRLLPSGIPAVLAFACAFGVLILFISQAWYEGPVARDGSGDCGIYVGFFVSVLGYAAFRGSEKWWERRRTLSKSEADGERAKGVDGAV